MRWEMFEGHRGNSRAGASWPGFFHLKGMVMALDDEMLGKIGGPGPPQLLVFYSAHIKDVRRGKLEGLQLGFIAGVVFSALLVVTGRWARGPVVSRKAFDEQVAQTQEARELWAKATWELHSIWMKQPTAREILKKEFEGPWATIKKKDEDK